MIEVTKQLEDISLVDFLGVQNVNFKELTLAYPKTKIVSRGNEIFIQGSELDVLSISDMIDLLIGHLQKFSSLSLETVKLILTNNGSMPKIEGIEDVIVFSSKGQPIKAKTPNQMVLVQAVNDNDLVFALGPAGTGKTYVSVALAVRALKNKEVKRIVFTRPAVEAGENLGFLPGDMKEKIDPYIRPIYDALEDMIPSEKLKQYQEAKTIEIAPLAYMRGRTLSNAFIILDEAQNTTPMQLKMFLTRMGVGSKVIITGDKSQIDLPNRQKSGLVDAIEILTNIKGIAFVELTTMDVTRHKLVRDIIKAYDHQSEERSQ